MSEEATPPPPAAGPSALQREVEAGAAGTTTVDHFGRTWVIPVKRHLKHLSAVRNGVLAGYGSYGLLVAEAFLSDLNHDQVPPGQVEALYDLNPLEEDLEEFAKKLTQILGLESPGNSSPSSPS